MKYSGSISSSRKSYEDMIIDELPEIEEEWPIEGKVSIKDKTILFTGMPWDKDSEEIRRMALESLKNRMKVYLPIPWLKKGFWRPGIRYFRRQTKYFAYALQKVNYIYATRQLPEYFGKTKEQIVVANIPGKKKTFEERLERDKVYLRSDIALEKKSEKRKEILGSLCRGEISKYIRQDKPRILFLVNLYYYNKAFVFFQQILEEIDLEKYEIVLFVYDKYLDKKKEEQIKALPRDVRIVIHSDTLMADEEGRKRCIFVDRESNFLSAKDIKEVDHFLGAGRILENEVRRTFADTKFEYIFNLMLIRYKDLLFAHHLEGKKILYTATNYETRDTAKCGNRLDWHLSFDEVMYRNSRFLDYARNLDDENYTSNGKVAPVMSKSLEKLRVAKSWKGFDSKKNPFILLDFRPRGMEDSKRATMVSIPVKKTSYCVVDPGWDVVEVYEWLDETIEREKELILFDFGRLIQADYVKKLKKKGKIYLYALFDIYPHIKEYLGKNITDEYKGYSKASDSVLAHITGEIRE